MRLGLSSFSSLGYEISLHRNLALQIRGVEGVDSLLMKLELRRLSLSFILSWCEGLWIVLEL